MSTPSCFPWEEDPSQDSFPELSETSYTIIEPEDQLALPSTYPSVENSEQDSRYLAAGILFPGGCPLRCASLQTDPRHMSLLWEGIAANASAISYIQDFGHRAIQHHQFVLGNHHAHLLELHNSVRQLQGHLNGLNTQNQQNFQLISLTMTEYHALLNFLRSRNISINEHLGPFIDERVQAHIPGIQQIHEHLMQVEASFAANSINPCDEQCPCRALRSEIDSLNRQYSDLVTRVAQLIPVSPNPSNTDEQIQAVVHPLLERMGNLEALQEEINSKLVGLETQTNPLCSQISRMENLLSGYLARLSKLEQDFTHLQEGPLSAPYSQTYYY